MHFASNSVTRPITKSKQHVLPLGGCAVHCVVKREDTDQGSPRDAWKSRYFLRLWIFQGHLDTPFQPKRLCGVEFMLSVFLWFKNSKYYSTLVTWFWLLNRKTSYN